MQASNPYLDYLIDQPFPLVNRHFVLLVENNTDRTVYTKYYLPKVELCYDRWKKHFNQPANTI